MDCLECQAFGIESYEMGLEGSPTQVAGMIATDKKRKAVFIPGSPEEMAENLVKKLHELDAI